MTDLQKRVRSGLGSDWDPSRSRWEGLMRLFEADREAFYLLACEGLDADGDEVTRPLADLAGRVRSAVRGTFRVEHHGSDEVAVLIPRSGGTIPVPSHLVAGVKRFLQEIDGKGASDSPGKDYEGRSVSEAEVRFKLGDLSDGEKELERARVRFESKPLVFRVREEDLRSLHSLPPYVTFGLTKCAKRTLSAPTSVYRGLNRGSSAPQRLCDGWAICGKPNRTFTNDGRAEPAPPGMLYMVFADRSGYVFDWDWVREDPAFPGHPLNMDLRFGNPVEESRDFVLELPDYLVPGKFDATKPAPSLTGDCVFCYMKGEPSFGERINEDLTVFYSLADQSTITGFKIKNVQRILTEEQALNLKDAPGLDVLVLPILRKMLPEHQDVRIKLYEIIITALVQVKLALPSPDENELKAATC
jgi:hypothetical protein